MPDKTLTMKWEVFRDKLRPGQKEEWKLTIKTPQGQAANAEMLATMYDASLDKIWNRQQNFQIFYNQIVPYSNWMSGYSGNNSFNYWWNTKSLKVPGLAYDYFVMSIRCRKCIMHCRSLWLMEWWLEDLAVHEKGVDDRKCFDISRSNCKVECAKYDTGFSLPMLHD